MHREFEELGLTIGGANYGHFTGEVQFDETGAPVIIDIETSNFGGSPLRLDIEELVRERIALRRKLGSGFLESGTRFANTRVSGCCFRAYLKASNQGSKTTSSIISQMFGVIEARPGMPRKKEEGR